MSGTPGQRSTDTRNVPPVAAQTTLSDPETDRMAIIVDAVTKQKIDTDQCPLEKAIAVPLARLLLTCHPTYRADLAADLFDSLPAEYIARYLAEEIVGAADDAIVDIKEEGLPPPDRRTVIATAFEEFGELLIAAIGDVAGEDVDDDEEVEEEEEELAEPPAGAEALAAVQAPAPEAVKPSALLEDWHAIEVSPGDIRYAGRIFEDDHGRFADGRSVLTGPAVDDCAPLWVETGSTIYYLGKSAAEGAAKEAA